MLNCTPTHLRRRCVLWTGIGFAALLTSCASVPSVAPELRRALAPTGSLRVAVYPGSPSSMVRAAGSEEMRGLSVTPPLLALELGYLAFPGSPVQSLSDVDRPDERIGVTLGSSSQAALTREPRQARVVTAPSLRAAGEMLQRSEIDAYATNKAVLFELADTLAGARMLQGRWGLEQLAIAVPKGRGAAVAEYLRGFAQAMRDEGLVRTASARAGLRGSAKLP